MFLDWTNWTFWVTALALIAFGFNLRVIYEQWRFWKIRKRPDEEIRELTQRLRTEAWQALHTRTSASHRVSVGPNDGVVAALCHLRAVFRGALTKAM